MHNLSTKFQVSECNIVISMHVPRYALDVPHHAVNTQPPGKVLCHSGTDSSLLLGSA